MSSSPTLHQPPSFNFSPLQDDEDTEEDLQFFDEELCSRADILLSVEPKDTVKSEIIIVALPSDEQRKTKTPPKDEEEQLSTKKKKKIEMEPEKLGSYVIRQELQRNLPPILDNDLRTRLSELHSQWEQKLETMEDYNYVCFPGWICEKMKQLVGKSGQPFIIEFHKGSILFWTRIGQLNDGVDSEINFQISIDTNAVEYYSSTSSNHCFVIKHTGLAQIFSNSWQSGGVTFQFKKDGLKTLYQVKLPQDQQSVQPWSQCEPKQYVATLLPEYAYWKATNFKLIPDLTVTSKSFLKESGSTRSAKDDALLKTGMEMNQVFPCNMKMIADEETFASDYVRCKHPDVRPFLVNHLVNDWTFSLISFWKQTFGIISLAFEARQIAMKSIFVVIEKTFNFQSTIIIWENESGQATFTIFSKWEKHQETIRNILIKGRDAMELCNCVQIEQYFEKHNCNAVAVKLGFMQVSAAIDKLSVNESPEILFSPFTLPNKQTNRVFFNWFNTNGMSIHISVPKQERT